ncbi:hypothetical protein DXG01_002829 [Tephrocybe rancida]|nr:hypothetical protein DXG01_002829 [Tephrocybe rancida]
MILHSSQSLPAMSSAYTVPHIPLLLTVSSFIYLLNVAEYFFSSIINAGLIGSLALGIIYGPEASDILPSYIQNTFIILGYIGLLLLVFEAGLSTNIALLRSNFFLSSIVALSGVAVPIFISLFLLTYGYGYTWLQAFGSGAALCSTSLGTTLSLLSPELRQTRTGAILLSAALLDDITGLIFAAIIPNLPNNGSDSPGIKWYNVIRPILTSLAFGIVTPMAAILIRRLALVLSPSGDKILYSGKVQVFIILAVLSGFVAGAQYAGTSELFGAYLAGAFLEHIFPYTVRRYPSETSAGSRYTPRSAFTAHILPLLHCFLSPIFFASIGAAIPIRSLFLVKGSRRVIWRGIVYSLLMVLAKAVVGLWILVWPDTPSGHGWCGSRRKEPVIQAPKEPNMSTSSAEHADEHKAVDVTRTRSAALVGLAMVARGEIALIVAQLARPLLVGDTIIGPHETSEPFAVVMWAILVSTVGGALGVGSLLRSWHK